MVQLECKIMIKKINNNVPHLHHIQTNNYAMNRLHEQSKRKNKSKEEAGMKSSIPPTIVNNIKAKTITFRQKTMIAKRKDNKQ